MEGRKMRTLSGESGKSGESGESGESGKSGEGGGGRIGSFTGARALVSNREGVVGIWHGIRTPPPNYVTNEKALDLWSTPVRLRTLQAELLSGIYYDDSGAESVSVYYRD